jgi:hypothetical protein
MYVCIKPSQFWTLATILYFIKKHVSETGFCIHPQVERIQMGPPQRISLKLDQEREREPSSFYWAHQSRLNLKTDRIQ